MVYGMDEQAWHGASHGKWYGLVGITCYMVCYGLAGMIWYMVWSGEHVMVYGMACGHHMVYGIAWQASHGI